MTHRPLPPPSPRQRAAAELRDYLEGAADALGLPAAHLAACLARVSPGRPLSRDAIRAVADHILEGRRNWRAAHSTRAGKPGKKAVR